jgi:BioD-like phosphotransacetylase family protein
MKKTRAVFIAATMQNDGKTTVSLGLIAALKRRFKRIGFIKPVGQRYLIENGYKVDEDSILVEKIFGFKGNIKDMSPLAIERGFTERYILRGGRKSLEKQILNSFSKISKGKDLVIIEGTGHAGVGSCFDLSNARVAKLLDAPVILISSGGIGKPIDEILLNKSLFDKEGVKILGVIINKVLEEKYEKVNRLIGIEFKKRNIELLGLLPYKETLVFPTIKLIEEELSLKLISPSYGLNNVVKKILVGAMAPHDALDYFENGCLIITPGDREDIILSALIFHIIGKEKGINVAGIIITGNMLPHKNILDFIHSARLPVLLSKQDTYLVASRIHDLVVKIKPEDKEKVKEVVNMVENHIDISRIIKKISESYV